MGTTHATNTSGAVFSDLFGADETVLNTALEQLGDNDLLFAVLVINTRPVNHGTGERTTARRLADIFAHAKTSGGASQIAHELFRNIRPGLIIECLCERTGVSEEDIDKAIKLAIETNDRPVVIDFIVSRDAMVWPMVAAGLTNDEVQYARDAAPIWDGIE